MMSHEKFAELIADAEIYVDRMATMWLHGLNSVLVAVRAMMLKEQLKAAADHGSRKQPLRDCHLQRLLCLYD